MERPDPAAEKIVLQDYHDDGSGKTPRYYQVNAINATIEAIATGRNRILPVMATDTGKTYTAFQIIWRLWGTRLGIEQLALPERTSQRGAPLRDEFPSVSQDPIIDPLAAVLEGPA